MDALTRSGIAIREANTDKMPTGPEYRERMVAYYPQQDVIDIAYHDKNIREIWQEKTDQKIRDLILEEIAKHPW